MTNYQGYMQPLPWTSGGAGVYKVIVLVYLASKSQHEFSLHLTVSWCWRISMYLCIYCRVATGKQQHFIKNMQLITTVETYGDLNISVLDGASNRYSWEGGRGGEMHGGFWVNGTCIRHDSMFDLMPMFTLFLLERAKPSARRGGTGAGFGRLW